MEGSSLLQGFGVFTPSCRTIACFWGLLVMLSGRQDKGGTIRIRSFLRAKILQSLNSSSSVASGNTVARPLEMF